MARMSHSVFICEIREIREIRGQNFFHALPWAAGGPAPSDLWFHTAIQWPNPAVEQPNPTATELGQ